MREIIACFPVYRTYVNERERGERPRPRLHRARGARGQAAQSEPSRRRLRLRRATCCSSRPTTSRTTSATSTCSFVGKFQQVTSPVTAKGIEDTALYIYNRLVSLNEVGGEPDRFGDDAGGAARAGWRSGPRAGRTALSATSTHDTKRSEDVRARINVLSEMPGAWKQATARWARANRRGADDRSTGSRIRAATRSTCSTRRWSASWPLEPMDDGRGARLPRADRRLHAQGDARGQGVSRAG